MGSGVVRTLPHQSEGQCPVRRWERGEAPVSLHVRVSYTRREHRALVGCLFYLFYFAASLEPYALVLGFFLERILAVLVFILGLRHKLLRGKSSEFGLGLCGVSSLGFTGASASQPQGKSRGPVSPHLNHKVPEWDGN